MTSLYDEQFGQAGAGRRWRSPLVVGYARLTLLVVLGGLVTAQATGATGLLAFGRKHALKQKGLRQRLIHAALQPLELNPTPRDQDGKSYRPREWFALPLSTAKDVVERIPYGAIAQYRLRTVSGQLVEKGRKYRSGWRAPAPEGPRSRSLHRPYRACRSVEELDRR